MKALTLWPEWAAAVAHLGKDVENRGWPPPDWLLGQRIAIHAGKNIGGRSGRVALNEGMEAVMGMYPGDGLEPAVDRAPPPGRGVRGYLLVDRSRGLVAPIVTSAIVATAEVSAVGLARGGWAVPNAEHWHLLHVRRVIEPVPCKGAQGLWDVPDEVLREVLAREVAI